MDISTKYSWAQPTSLRVMSIDLHTYFMNLRYRKSYDIEDYPQNIICKFTIHCFNDVEYSSHVKYFQHSPSHVSYIISKITFDFDTILVVTIFHIITYEPKPIDMLCMCPYKWSHRIIMWQIIKTSIFDWHDCKVKHTPGLACYLLSLCLNKKY